MQQKRSVNFSDWERAYKEGYDSFVMECGQQTSGHYINQFRTIPEIKTAEYKGNGVVVTFNKEESAKEEDKFKNILPYFAVGFVSFMVSFTITFFVMY